MDYDGRRAQIVLGAGGSEGAKVKGRRATEGDATGGGIGKGTASVDRRRARVCQNRCHCSSVVVVGVVLVGVVVVVRVVVVVGVVGIVGVVDVVGVDVVGAVVVFCCVVLMFELPHFSTHHRQAGMLNA